MSKTYVIGHTKPDTDSVVAAMALQYLYQQHSCFGHQEVEAVVSDPLNPETSFLFKKFGVKAPRKITVQDIEETDRVVLVDHNEESQRLPGLNQDQIVEIVDHHKANLNFSQPIFLTFKTWGSSNTIIYFMMKKNEVKPDKTLASLMLAAILSDTVGFKSATTTDKDKELGQELAQIAGITNLDDFALEIFKAKSDISSLSDEEIVKNDYKVFDFGKKVFVDQIETVEQDVLVSNKKSALLTAMQQIKTQEKVDLLFVAVTDILKVNTKLLILGDEEASVATTAFGGEVVDNILDIGPKMSRKKEIAPALEKTLKQ
ncbi:MAG: manganese-dependent inorganic pyrophosphatase [Patescibacteria group bacterium]